MTQFTVYAEFTRTEGQRKDLKYSATLPLNGFVWTEVRLIRYELLAIELVGWFNNVIYISEEIKQINSRGLSGLQQISGPFMTWVL